MGPAALLDACVLYPVGLRDTLLSVAQAGAFRPLWSGGILDELRGAILRSVEAVDPARIDRMLDDMQSAFPEAMVRVSDRVISRMANDPADRHVLAAAVAGHADVLVTWNVRHFPVSACRSLGVRVFTPDEFLAGLVAADSAAVVEALERQSGRYDAPAMSVDEILRRHAPTMPRFAAAVGAVRGKLRPS